MHRLRIVVGGLAVTFPLGGMFWHYLQYVLGLQQMGHHVLYLEDVGRWCYHPLKRTYVESGGANAARFKANVACLPVELSWYFRDATGVSYGLPSENVQEFCRNADVFINLSASHDVRSACPEARCKVLVDTDPLYTQALLDQNLDVTKDEKELAVLDNINAHDEFFTMGLNVGGSDCLVPTGNRLWRPLLQPIVLREFRAARKPLSHRRNTLTTVASWEPKEATTRVGNDLFYGKSHEFTPFMDLPRHNSVSFELALSGEPPVQELQRAGWSVIDGYSVSTDPSGFQRYCATSLGEFSVAKHAYVASRSGWFSDRSAVYLALGVPVLLQDTGYGCLLPTGEGLLPFSDFNGACEAVEALASNPARHAEAAVAIAEDFFEAGRVLQPLLDAVAAYV